MKISEKIALRLEGRKAHKEGKPAASCPYDGHSAAAAIVRDNWLHGWWHRAYEQTDPAVFKPPHYVPDEIL